MHMNECICINMSLNRSKSQVFYCSQQFHYHQHKMENLIPVFNELQDVFLTAGMEAIQLPQIVVVGIQSAGKSSVLESFVGESFLPRGEGIVTRCPIILQLVHDPKCIEKWCEFQHQPGKRFTNFEEVEQELQHETNRLAGTNSGIVNKPIRLKVHASTVVDLTVVDLPGIVKVPVGDQNPHIENEIETMILEYIKNKNSIILAICAANQDLPTSDSIKLAKQVDPDGSRTMTVLTKLDKADDLKITHKILSGRLIPMKHGIVGVVNRSRDDVLDGKSIQDAKLDERKFLKENYPMLAKSNGSDFLAGQLSSLLKAHVIERLPAVENTIATLQLQLQRKMEDLGGDDLPADKSRTILDIIHYFSVAFAAEIDGKSRNLQKTALYGQVRMGHVFEKTFAATLKEIDPLEDLTDDEILNTIVNSRTLSSRLYHPEDAYQDLVRVQLKKFREPSLLCADLINHEMQLVIRNCLESEHVKDMVTRFPKLKDELVRVSTELLSKQMKIARERVEDYIRSLASFIQTYSPEFDIEFKKQTTNLDVRKPEIADELILIGSNDPIYVKKVVRSNGNEPDPVLNGNAAPDPDPAAPAQFVENQDAQDPTKQKVKIVRILVQTYFENERKKIQDEIPRILVHHVIYFTQQQIQKELSHELHIPAKYTELIQVSDQVLEERASTTKMLEKMKRGAKIIQAVRSGGK